MMLYRFLRPAAAPGSVFEPDEFFRIEAGQYTPERRVDATAAGGCKTPAAARRT